MQTQAQFHHRSVSFHRYFRVFHTKLSIGFRRLVLVEMTFLRRYLKQSYRSLQYDVNNLGTRFLSTCYSNFWWIPQFLKVFRPQYPCWTNFEVFMSKTQVGIWRGYHDFVVFHRKLLFQSVFLPHERAKPEFLNSSALKGAFEKLRFRQSWKTIAHVTNSRGKTGKHITDMAEFLKT